MNDHTNRQGRNYSFLAWLIVPLLLSWIGSNYIIGALEEKPEWAEAEAPIENVDVAPYDVEYSSIEKGTNGLVTLWFDDAWKSQYMIAAPILKDANMDAALAVPSGLVGFDDFANWAQIRTLQKSGWEITNHSVVHDCEMENWSSDRMKVEFINSTNELWRHNVTSDHFVAPCGVNSPELTKEVEKHFLSYRGTEPGYNDLSNLDPFDLKVRNVTNITTISEMKNWIKEAQENNLWLILVFHQIGTEEQGKGEKFSITTENFTTIINHLKTLPIKVVLPSQALLLQGINE